MASGSWVILIGPQNSDQSQYEWKKRGWGRNNRIFIMKLRWEPIVTVQLDSEETLKVHQRSIKSLKDPGFGSGPGAGPKPRLHTHKDPAKKDSGNIMKQPESWIELSNPVLVWILHEEEGFLCLKLFVFIKVDRSHIRDTPRLSPLIQHLYAPTSSGYNRR